MQYDIASIDENIAVIHVYKHVINIPGGRYWGREREREERFLVVFLPLYIVSSVYLEGQC